MVASITAATEIVGLDQIIGWLGELTGSVNNLENVVDSVFYNGAAQPTDPNTTEIVDKLEYIRSAIARSCERVNGVSAAVGARR